MRDAVVHRQRDLLCLGEARASARQHADDAHSEERRRRTRSHSVARRYDRPVDPRPVGVFDSGVGGPDRPPRVPRDDAARGLRLPRRPCAAAVRARARSTEVRRFAREIGAFLERQGVKLIVIACNTATSAALPQLQEELDVPVVGVITPEAHAAVQATRNRRIGPARDARVRSTRGTVRGARPRARRGASSSSPSRARGSCR